MKVICKKFLVVSVMLFMVSSLFFGCSTTKKDKVPETNEYINKSSFYDFSGRYSSWAVYWDLKVNGEVKLLEDELKSVSYFAAYFNSDNSLMIPTDLMSFYEASEDAPYKKYLSIVNDRIGEDGKSQLKSTQVLKELFSDKDSLERHISDIVEMTVTNGFDGIEIDYEQLGNDVELWQKFSEFIIALYNRALEKGLELKVILEPSAPIEKINLPEGPCYVMMCYNLHGAFSEPGPKANPVFIDKLISKMKLIPGDKEFAIATGGFDWISDCTVVAVTEQKAVEEANRYGAKPVRDKESGYMILKYKDQLDNSHELWYADAETLKNFMRIITEEGYDVCLWRLGGNKF